MKKGKWIILLLILLLLSSVLYFYLNKSYNGADFNIKNYQSKLDKDEDGLDDQTDILKNAKDYIATKPKYQSKYYGGGYPNDGYGVCTDVVAFSLKRAGYDLRELLNEDVNQNPEDYDIEVRDKNIDFRRVNNLNVYFSHTAISLTTDLKDIDEWQGGDIVVFQKHIGIISDKRNRKGIPYLIHHANPFQLKYEENVLERLNSQIVAHYRIS